MLIYYFQMVGESDGQVTELSLSEPRPVSFINIVIFRAPGPKVDVSIWLEILGCFEQVTTTEATSTTRFETTTTIVTKPTTGTTSNTSSPPSTATTTHTTTQSTTVVVVRSS